MSHDTPPSPFLSLLREPTHAIAAALSLHVARERPGKQVLETSEPLFDPLAHAHAGLAFAEVRGEGPPRWSWSAGEVGQPSQRALRTGWIDVTWQGARLEVMTLGFESQFGAVSLRAIVADDLATARAYFDEVCAHCAEVRDEVLVYANGCWNKSKDLFASVRSASWEQLVLAEGLAETIRGDFDRFVAARADYERWGVPWKRGAIFIGPPGNGKTMCIRALIRHLGLPCVYVQSFVAPRVPEQLCIREVFERARRTAPCVMVLEDLDSLVSANARSFFLNELDGFAANTGLVTIASTNHPDRLDPAIVDRPSRFDRKYHFDLPAERERRRYLALWAARLAPELRPDEAALDRVASETDAFSFAYLKELFAAALMRFASEGTSGGDLASILEGELGALRRQMQTHNVVPDGAGPAIPEADPWDLRRRRLL